MKAKTINGAGSGWHKESLRHRNARLHGKAGGKYRGRYELLKFDNHVGIYDTKNKKRLAYNLVGTKKEIIKAKASAYESGYTSFESDNLHKETFKKRFINKKELEKLETKFKDSDGDGVPDKYDCQPNNPNAQGTNKQVADAFAEGRTDSSGTMFIEGDVVYSYGHHFPIAVRLKDGSYLINKDKYSNTTSRHQSLVRRALANNKTVEGDTAMLIKASGKNSYEGTRNDAWGGRTDKINNRLRSLSGQAYELPEELKPAKDPELQKLREQQGM